jgi:hypothetical protein
MLALSDTLMHGLGDADQSFRSIRFESVQQVGLFVVVKDLGVNTRFHG